MDVNTLLGSLGITFTGGVAVLLEVQRRYLVLHNDSTQNTLKLGELAAKVGDLDKSLVVHKDAMRQSSLDFAKDAELARFIVEQHERWESVQRTLGLIEGILSSNGIPPPRPR